MNKIYVLLFLAFLEACSSPEKKTETENTKQDISTVNVTKKVE